MTLEFKYVFSELQVSSQDSHIRWGGLPLLEGEDDDMWNVVLFGLNVVVLQAPSDEEKKLIQLDAQAEDEIGGHLNRAQFLHYRQC